MDVHIGAVRCSYHEAHEAPEGHAPLMLSGAIPTLAVPQQ